MSRYERLVCKHLSHYRKRGFRLVNDRVYCDYCEYSIKIDKTHIKTQLSSHLRSQRHQRNEAFKLILLGGGSIRKPVAMLPNSLSYAHQGDSASQAADKPLIDQNRDSLHVISREEHSPLMTGRGQMVDRSAKRAESINLTSTLADGQPCTIDEPSSNRGSERLSLAQTIRTSKSNGSNQLQQLQFDRRQSGDKLHHQITVIATQMLNSSSFTPTKSSATVQQSSSSHSNASKAEVNSSQFKAQPSSAIDSRSKGPSTQYNSNQLLMLSTQINGVLFQSNFRISFRTLGLIGDNCLSQCKLKLNCLSRLFSHTTH
jgi:hypothetical protein